MKILVAAVIKVLPKVMLAVVLGLYVRTECSVGFFQQEVQTPHIPAHVTDIGQIWHCYDPQERMLNLKYAPIDQIDDRVFVQIALYWPELKFLNLWGTRLRALSPRIDRLRNLVSLDLSRSLLESLPAEIGQLPDLYYLSLDGTPLSWLPAQIGDLPNLMWLFLSNTHLQELPIQIIQLPRLTMLGLAHTPLVESGSWGDVQLLLVAAYPHIELIYQA